MNSTIYYNNFADTESEYLLNIVIEDIRECIKTGKTHCELRHIQKDIEALVTEEGKTKLQTEFKDKEISYT